METDNVLEIVIPPLSENEVAPAPATPAVDGSAVPTLAIPVVKDDTSSKEIPTSPVSVADLLIKHLGDKPEEAKSESNVNKEFPTPSKSLGDEILEILDRPKTTSDSINSSSELKKAEEKKKIEATVEKTPVPQAEQVGSSIKTGKLIRNKDGNTYRLCKSAAWGVYLSPAEDPDGIALSKEEINGIKLVPNFPRLPADLWSRYIELCFHLCPTFKMDNKFHDSQLEVSVVLLRSANDLRKWKIVVPRQVVSGASVKADLTKSIDIETGEEYTQFPPVGWLHAGSSHSHNTMSAFFSSVDDKSELTVPGTHIVVGGINHKKLSYEWVASIVVQGMRKTLDVDQVVDINHMPDVTFHPNVLNYVKAVSEQNTAKLLDAMKPKYFFPGQNNSEVEVLSIKDISNKEIAKQREVDWEDVSFWGNNYKDGSWVGPSSKKNNKKNKKKDKKEDKKLPFQDVKELLFDESGKPTAFFRGLDKHNSDLFDDTSSDLGEVPLVFLAEAVMDCLRQGWSLEDMLDVVKETASDAYGYKPDDDDDDDVISWRTSAYDDLD